MPVSKNTWNKGLNSDLSKLKSQPDSYLSASNIRVITDEGNSTFAIENIKGNKFNFRLPVVEKTYKIDFTNITGNVTVTISRSTINLPITLLNVNTKSNETLSQELNSLIQSSSFPGKEFIKVYFNNNFLVVYDFLPQSSNLSGVVVTTSPNCSEDRTSRVSSHCILGWGYYNDNLVLISCFAGNNVENPQSTEGFIWNCTYDNATNEIIPAQIESQNYLLPATTLKYAGKLNLSRQYAINEHLKCRYESVEVARLVWTDWYNNLRTCNLLDPQIWATPEELFSYIPAHAPQKPIISKLITGGTLPAGKYQYFYQLYSNQGASSSYSPVSSLVSLFSGNLSNYQTPGNLPGINSQKSVQIELINLDTNYDSIRVGYIVYQIPDFPEAFFFDERVIPDDGTVTVVHNGNENDIPVDSTEIANLNRPPEVFKTIDVVRNRLFAANAITKYFDPVFDARAYRFNSAQEANLYNNEDAYGSPSVFIDIPNNEITIELVTSPLNYELIPESFDVINPYNNEDDTQPLNNSSWITNSQYKFKADGLTLGGEGLNISYEFITESQLANLTPPISNLYNGGLPFIRPALDNSTDFTSPFNDTYTYYGSSNTSLDSMKNPYIETLFTGYSRGEVYRFGIVFYDIYGYPSYVNWIGDIKFPLASDSDINGHYGLTNSYSDGISGLGDQDLYTKQLGIKFTLDTSKPQFQAIKEQISGWSYVRVRRDINNSTRLGTGYMQPTWYLNGSGGFYSLMPYKRNSSINVTLNNEWYFNEVQSGFWRTRVQYQTFYSPNFLLRKSGDYIAGDYMRMIGRSINTDPVPVQSYSQFVLNPPAWGSNIYLYCLSSRNFNYNYNDTTNNPLVPISEATSSLDSNGRNKYTIANRTYVSMSTTQNFIPVSSSSGLDFPFINMANEDSTNANSKEFTEWGAETTLITFATDPHPDTSNLYFQYSNSFLPIYLTSYERYLTKQYGGALRANRYANEYILTNHFQPWDRNNPQTGLITNAVFGGDTYVNYFDWQRTNVNYLDGSGYTDDTSDMANNPPFGLAVFFPCESSFNTELNTTSQHASIRSLDSSGSNTVFISNYVYNDALSQENTSNVFLSKAFNQTNVKNEPHTIYGTEPKLDNERLDSWRSFLINNSLTVNGNYGEINRLVQFKDKLYYYQNDGFGIASVDERVLANEGDSTQTQLGTGTLLQRFDYISTETGVKHSFAVRATGSAIYHYDAFINKLFRYSMSSDGAGVSPLTDIKGLSGFFRTAFADTNLKSEDKLLRIGTAGRVGITTGYNSEYNTVYFTFFCKDTDNNTIQHTISYNELLDSFESFYDFYPSLYLNMRKRFISVNPAQASDGYVHNIGKRNTFYGQYYPSSVTFRVNENSDFVKTFDNFIINTEVILNNIQLAETISQLGIVNDYQIVNQQNANFTQKIRSWRKQIPRDETNSNLTIKPRIADKYIDVTFTHDPLNLDKTFRLHDVMTEYSLRSKILPR